jgi:CubicO group peptidase (beta-lactamase class C family)
MGAALAFGATAGYGATMTRFLGDWFGALDLGSRRLRLKLVVSEGPRSVLYSIDQGNSAIPASQTKIDGDKIFISWPSIAASYAGQLAGGVIAGQFTQGGMLPLKFSRTPEEQAKPTPLTQAGLAKLRAEVGAPAMAAAALKLNGRRAAFVDGVRAVGRSQTATVKDKWHIGSCGKSITATLVARAAEAGVIGWNDTVGQTLGTIVPGMRAEYRDATYRHLLSHQSGLAGNIDLAELIKFPRTSADARGDRLAYAQAVLARAPEGPKGAHFEYSNSGYVVAGAMLEARLRAPWETLVQDHVFAPLKMTSAGFGAPGTPGAVDQPAGHAPGASGALEPYPPGTPVNDNPAVLGPAGRVHVAFDDLLSYLSAHCARSAFLRGESWEMLHAPPFGGTYAMGWERRGDVIWHNGSNTLWYCEMQADFVRGIVSAAAANDGRVDVVTAAVGHALASVAEAVA